MSLISSYTSSNLPDLTKLMLITMSISEAPLSQASVASKTLVAVVEYPLGNPITVQTATLPLEKRTASFTKQGWMQTDAVLRETALSIR